MSFNAATGHLKHSLKPKANKLVPLFLNFGRHRKRRRLGPFFSHLASRIITPHFVDAVSCVCSASACLILPALLLARLLPARRRANRRSTAAVKYDGCCVGSTKQQQYALLAAALDAVRAKKEMDML